MKRIIKGRWWVVLAWITLVAGLFYIAPNMADLVREKGELEVPEGYSSKIASHMLTEAQGEVDGKRVTQVALVFHNEHKLTASDIQEVERAIRLLEQKKGSLGIEKLITHFHESQLKEQLVSKDGKSILVSLGINWDERDLPTLNDALVHTLKNVKVKHYYTSEWMITDQLMEASQEGVKKTEGITVVFILLVLLLVFRSVVAPIIPLVTVGVSYLASQSIVSILVDQFDFPISTNTQSFLIAVLFGIGTDYCILLLSRFKEELSYGRRVFPSIVSTYKNAGRTVFFSGLAVLIGFAAIGLSEFKLYQSASAVAVGVVILLIALFTLVPFFMAVLGKTIFWPSKKKLEHAESKLWGVVGKFSLSRPIISLLLVGVICVPFIFTYEEKLSFNSLEEIGDDATSVKAFHIISSSFGPGESMPTKVVLKNDERMDSVEYFHVVEKMSRELEKVDLVKSVRSITRPVGEPIEDFLIAKQSESLEKGLGDGKQGISEISAGLHQAGSKLSKSEPELKSTTKGINGLIDGTTQVESGLTEIQTNLAKIENGIRKGTMGSAEVKKGLETTKAGAQELLTAYQELQKGYKEVGTNLGNLSSGYREIEKNLKSLSGALNQIRDDDFATLESQYEGLASTAQYQKIKGTVLTIQQQLTPLANGIKQLNSGLADLKNGVDTANTSFQQANAGQANLIIGLEEFIQGVEKQKSGLEDLANGQEQIVKNVPQLTNGLSEITDGQKKLLNGFGDLEDQLGELTTGLTQSADGLEKVSDGLGSAQSYLTGLSNASSVDGFYMPQDVLKNKDFGKVLDAYLSADRKTMTMDVVFNANPYSRQTMDQVDKIKDAVQRATKGTKLENAVVAVGGISSINTDLNTMSNQDYSRTVILMLIGIGMILVFLFRSIIMPLYTIGSLFLTYYTTMAINEVIFVDILGYGGISWAVPFFGFVILMALGVDYSIFLMERFNEYHDLTVEDAMLLAMKKMGTVIISAVIILGGTFAAMIPSGMLSLIQIASIILIGLLLYTFVVLPLFIPVLVKNFGQANWWPFRRGN